LTVAARAAFAFAGHEAETLGSAAIDLEHIFLGLCKVESIRDISAEEASELNETELQTLRQEVKAFAATVESAGLDVVRARRRLRKLWREAHPDSEEFSGHRTPRCRQVFAEAAALSKGPIDLVALMRAVLVAGPPLLDRLFSEMGIDRSRLLDTLGGPAQFREDEISKYGRDLTRLAKDGKLHRAIGRKKEMKQVARILLQAKKSNPLLVGDAGVGKTAIVEGLALQLLQADSPAALRSLRIVEVSLGALVAGTKYRGEFEERLEQVVRFAEADPSLVLFIDEIHMLLGAGDVRGAMDAANLLKPALARGTMRLIGSTTSEEYRRRIEKDPALTRRFQVVWVEEPSREATIEILDGLRAATPALKRPWISQYGSCRPNGFPTRRSM
jgi:ATP-dependent Clp protease ATP-binding subunit ClpA